MTVRSPFFFCRVYKTACRCIRCRAIRARSDGAVEWGAIGRESEKEENAKKKKRRRYLVAISWYYLHLPGEMRWLVCSGRHLYPDERTGTGILHTHVTYLYTFHFFVGKCARAARGRERDTVGRRIKPGFYYKGIQIPRTRPSPYSALSAEACGAGSRGMAERRGRPYEYKKLSGPRESPRGVNP